MSSKQVLIVTVLVAVFSWSVVMAALGQLAAVATLVSSLGLLVQQIVQAFAAIEARRSAAPAPQTSAADEERAR